MSLNQNGKITDLSVLTQGQPLLTGLSDAGHVIGFGPSAFVYQNGTITNLGSLGGGSTQTEVWGVNAAGQVVGFSSTSPTNPGDTIHAFLYQNGKIADLGTLGGSRSWGWGLNSHGQVIGMSSKHTDLLRSGHCSTCVPPYSLPAVLKSVWVCRRGVGRTP